MVGVATLTQGRGVVVVVGSPAVAWEQSHVLTTAALFDIS